MAAALIFVVIAVVLYANSGVIGKAILYVIMGILLIFMLSAMIQYAFPWKRRRRGGPRRRR